MFPEIEFYDMSIWDHLLALIICIFAPVLAIVSRRIASDEIKLESVDKIRLYHSNGLLLIVFAMIVMTTWRMPGRSLSGLGLDWPVGHPYIPILLFVIFLFYAFDVFMQYGNRKRRERTYEQRHKNFAFVPADGKELFHFIFLALAAGIGEEIIFRGYLIHYLVYWTGNAWPGILLACLSSSALFAFLHGYQGIRSMMKIFFLAVLFCGVFIFSQSLLIVILVHTVIDTLSGLVSIYFLKNMSRES